jgi:hypothetical protein
MQRFQLRWYGLEEFELVLESLGFSEVVVSADHEYGRRYALRASKVKVCSARDGPHVPLGRVNGIVGFSGLKRDDRGILS